MVVDKSGRLFFADSFGALGAPRRVYVLDPPIATAQPRPLPIRGNIPSGLTFRGDDLLVADTGAGNVKQLNANLQVVEQWAIEGPWNTAVHPDGFLLAVTDEGEVQKLLPGGLVEPLIEGLDHPFDLAIAPDGTFWVSEQGEGTGRVSRFDLAGQRLETVPGVFEDPEGILVDAKGGLLIADTSAGKLFRYQDGHTEVKLDNLHIPVMLAEGPNDEIWMSLSRALVSMTLS